MSHVVARIGKPHGIRGEVTVHLHTDDPRGRFAIGTVLPTQARAGSGVSPVERLAGCASRRASAASDSDERWERSMKPPP